MKPTTLHKTTAARQAEFAEILDRVPPSDIEAERSLIGAIIFKPSGLDEVPDILTPSHFHDERWAAIYETMLSMHASGKQIDLTLLREVLRQRGLFERVGGGATLFEAMNPEPMAKMVLDYADVIVAKASKRACLRAGERLLVLAHDNTKTATEAMVEAEGILASARIGQADGGPCTSRTAIQTALEHIEAIRARGSSMGVPTGFAGFDEQVGGLFPGELIVIAARPGIGKTTLAVQISENAATARDPRRVFFASLEMDRREIAMRMLCRRADVNLLTIRHGRISYEERDRIGAIANELDSIHEHFIIHDKPRMTVGEIRRNAQRFNPQLIIVDYLQRVVPDDRKKQRYEQVADVTRGLKTMAREMNAAVVVLAQSSRDADNGGEPELRQLRESGDIEAEADVVTFLQTNVPWEKGGEAAPHRARWHIAKNRNGPTPWIRLTWDATATAFRDPEDMQHHARFRQPLEEFAAYSGDTQQEDF